MLSKWIISQIRPFVLSLSVNTGLGVVASLSSVGMAVASKVLIDAATEGKDFEAISAGIAFAVLILTFVVLQAVVSIRSTRVLEEISNRIRKNLFAKLCHTEWMDYSKYHSEDILTRMTSDVGIVANGIANTLPEIISLGVQLFAAFITLLIFEPMLALLAFIIGPAVILLSRLLGKKFKHLYTKTQEAESTYRSFLQESILNLLIIKTFGQEKKSVAHIDQLHRNRLTWVLRRNRSEAIAGSLLSFGYWTGFFLAFGWGAFSISKGETSFGTFAAFIQLVEQIQAPFIGLSFSLPQLVSTAASAERIMELEALHQERMDDTIPNLPVAGVLFDNITFSYIPTKQILNKATSEIRPGEIVAIVGKSGEGKTTLIRLMLSFIQPNSGQVYFIDNHGSKFEVCAANRFLISYVPQGNTIFSGTIAENLRMGNPSATEEEIECAARSAYAWDFIEKLPEGVNTIIGERGLGLSDGQAQRLAIARALLHKTPILVLDEATSELDVDTEIKILQSIKNLSPTRTCIIITHRHAALGICQRVILLEEGHLVENTNKIIEDLTI